MIGHDTIISNQPPLDTIRESPQPAVACREF
jgi:hypothetical protein